MGNHPVKLGVEFALSERVVFNKQIARSIS